MDTIYKWTVFDTDGKIWATDIICGYYSRTLQRAKREATDRTTRLGYRWFGNPWKTESDTKWIKNAGPKLVLEVVTEEQVMEDINKRVENMNFDIPVAKLSNNDLHEAERLLDKLCDNLRWFEFDGKHSVLYKKLADRRNAIMKMQHTRTWNKDNFFEHLKYTIIQSATKYKEEKGETDLDVEGVKEVYIDAFYHRLSGEFLEFLRNSPNAELFIKDIIL